MPVCGLNSVTCSTTDCKNAKATDPNSIDGMSPVGKCNLLRLLQLRNRSRHEQLLLLQWSQPHCQGSSEGLTPLLPPQHCIVLPLSVAVSCPLVAVRLALEVAQAVGSKREGARRKPGLQGSMLPFQLRSERQTKKARPLNKCSLSSTVGSPQTLKPQLGLLSCIFLAANGCCPMQAEDGACQSTVPFYSSLPYRCCRAASWTARCYR